MAKPYIGMIVQYTPHEGEVDRHGKPVSNSPQPLAAVITNIHNSGLVTLAIWKANGNTFPAIHRRYFETAQEMFTNAGTLGGCCIPAA